MPWLWQALFRHIQFFQRLDQLWQGRNPKRNRLLSVVIILNKIDKLEDPKKIDIEKRLREITETHFRAARPKAVTSVRFKPCIMVENAAGTKYVDAILIDIALDLKKAQ